MPFRTSDSIHYFFFESFDAAGVTHGVITRRGGVSLQPWDSLNVGATVGDDLAHVQENRRRTFQAFGRPLDTLFDVWQVHSADVVCSDAPRPPEQEHARADAILTDRPGVTLFMRFADCVPVLLYDPARKAAGLVHAGWQGTVRGTLTAAVEAMQAQYGSRPEDLLSGIGPSIGAHHYEVGPEVAEQVQAAFGADASALMQPSPGANGSGRVLLDLWSANRVLLERLGVRRIEVAGVCTACHVQDWYSHRAEKGRTGRFGALIAV
jgi:YfiH family protein